MAADKTTKMKAADSVVGYGVGDDIAGTENHFVPRADAFFAERASDITVSPTSEPLHTGPS